MGFVNELVQNLPRPLTKEERNRSQESKNPWKIVTSLTPMQGALFMSGYFAWMMDAVDFFGVSLTSNRLGRFFGKDTHSITTAITLTLLLRSAGALIFGLLSDRYGRKWPLVINLLIVAALELSTAYTVTFSQFLAVRSLFGIGMGGIWGLATANSLENLPIHARGLFSGILQQGYAAGYLVAAVINLTAVEHYDRWQVLFYIGAGLSLFAAAFRAILPESEFFLRAKATETTSTTGKSKMFLRQMKKALRIYWKRAIFAILLMSFFNYYSHGSQDLLPVYYENAKGFSAYDASVLTIIGNCGAITGGLFMGYFSQYIGRRLTIIIACCFCAAFIPLWVIPSSFSALAAGVFFVQVGVQGAWAIIPIYLSELSPPAFRAVFPSLAYQLGNAASSASAQIEATLGESVRTTGARGQDIPDYGLIQGWFIGVVSLCIILCCLVGPEDHGSNFESAKAAYQEDAGEATAPMVGRRLSATDPSSVEKGEKSEKGRSEYLERAE